MSFKMIQSEVKHMIAHVHVDRVGRTLCTECVEAREIKVETSETIYEPYTEFVCAEGDKDNLCEICERNPWHCAYEVTSPVTVEFVDCKIF